MYPVHTNPDGSRYRWDGQRWVPLPPQGPSRSLLVLSAIFVGLVLLVASVVVFAARNRVTTAGPGTSAAPTTRSGQRASTTTSRAGRTTPPGDETPSTTNGGDAVPVDENFFLAWLPALRTAKAPSWVSQGTRITYYAAAASVPGSYHQYVEDENGGWVNPETGDRYRREDVSGAAGHGYNEVSVTALDDSVAALNIRAYGLTDLDRSSPVTTLSWGGAVGLPGAGSDYWLSPEVLAGVDETVTDTLKVVRMPYTAEGKEYSSIWIQSIGDRGNYTWVYDLDTGVLLHTASATTGPPITGPVAEGEGREGSTFLTGSTLVNIRQPSLPWASSSAPSWVGSTTHFEYTGTVTVEVPGTSPVVLDASLAVDERSSGTNWARYRFARTMRSTVAPSVTESLERVDGPGQVGALWVAPDALAGLSAGDQLDHDPVTQVDVSVASVDQTDSGFTVTIRESGPGEVSELVYDGRTGLMVASSYQNLHLYNRTDFRLADQA